MKVFVFIISCALINAISAFTVNQIEGIQGVIEQVKLDSHGNIYVAAATLPTRHQLYKLNSAKEIQWIIPLPNYVEFVAGMHITRDDDIYFVFYYDSTDLSILKSNSTEIEIVEEKVSGFFYKDPNDNIFYTGENGIRMLRPGSTVPIAITNLDSVGTFNYVEVAADKSGNVYLGVNTYIAVITYKSLQQETPSATLISLQERQNVISFTVDEKDQLWASVIDYNGQGVIGKVINETWEVIATDDNYIELEMVPAKNRLFIIQYESIFQQNNANVYIITSENEKVAIPELTNSDFDDTTTGVADSEGNAYITSRWLPLSYDLGFMILIKNNETKPIPIEFETREVNVYYLALDLDEDLWMVTLESDHNLYFLKKGEVVAQKVDLPDQCAQYEEITLNRDAKELYLFCNGLYVVTKDF